MPEPKTPQATAAAGAACEPPAIGPAALRAMLADGGELALLDMREEGVFDRGHLLHAVPLPLSQLELRIGALVPRRSARIVLCDGDGGALVGRAAARLRELGYTDIRVLAGGLAAWRVAGFEVFAGVNVPSKAFGEFVEHHEATPGIDARELHERLARGEDIVILDSRPYDEFHQMSIPGGLDCPGAELVLRAFDAVPSPATTIVVNCAGRTRSIIGAQSLINAGLPNEVRALRNGTMGWHLAGLEVARGAERRAPPPSADGLARAQAAAARIARRFGVAFIGEGELRTFEAERDRRSLFLLDVRDPAEFAAGHLADARSAPGGQLVQATDRYVGTRHARLVLIDDKEVRAVLTASWLLQMGWRDVFVLREPHAAGRPMAQGPEAPPALPAGLPPPDGIEPGELAAAAGEGVVVLDFDTSLRYRAGHVPGAWFAVRARLPADLGKLPPHRRLVLTSADGRLAALAAADLAGRSRARVQVLAGGTRAWRAAGLPLETGFARLLTANDDVWYRPYDRHGEVEAHMRAYLSWEVDLVAQVERDGTAGFRHFPADGG